MSLKKIVEFELPLLPNYIIAKDRRVEKFHISEFPEEQLRQMGAEWTEELVKKAKQKEILDK